MCNFDTIHHTTLQEAEPTMGSPLQAATINVDSSSGEAPPMNSCADEVVEAEKAEEDSAEEEEDVKKADEGMLGKPVFIGALAVPNEVKKAIEEAQLVSKNAFYGSRHADPDFVPPSKDNATKTKWAAPAPSAFPKPSNTQKQPRNGQGNRGRGGFRGARGRGGGYQQSAPKAAVPATNAAPTTTAYPGKTQIKEADWAKEHDRYLGNVKGFRNDPEMIDAMMVAWMGAIVIVLPDGREVLATEYSSTSTK